MRKRERKKQTGALDETIWPELPSLGDGGDGGGKRESGARYHAHGKKKERERENESELLRWR